MQNPNEDTQWNGQLCQFNIIDSKEETKTEEEQFEIDRDELIECVNHEFFMANFCLCLAQMLDQKKLDVLHELEDEKEERVPQENRRKRLLGMKEKSARARFSEVIEISAVDYIKDVNQVGNDIWVVVCLHKSGMPLYSLISDHRCSLVQKYRKTKFVESISTVCIPNYPDENLPTLFIYNNGELDHSLIGPFAFGEMNYRFEYLEYRL